LAALRAIPHLFVVRPADVHEVREAWRLAILRREAPTALALTRQKVPLIDRKKFAPAEGLRRGAYVLAEGERVRTGSGSDRTEDSTELPQLILIATGSEVSLALEAREQLQTGGIATRVVSMPCVELFEEQSQDYRDEVLPPSVTARLSIEAGVGQGWDRYVGAKGDKICLERFGASAPGDIALKNLGFNVENVVKHARKLITQ
jgi:transketolase